jgi:hypothetical protein
MFIGYGLKKRHAFKPIIRSVAIEVGDKAFFPEAYVYLDMFLDKGVDTRLLKRGSPEIMQYDAVILFHGLHPFWRKYPKIVIGEYHSLSVGIFSRFKDAIKRIINVRADYYIVLNDFVKRKIWLSGKENVSTRHMGYARPSCDDCQASKEFDVVYCGSYRNGLIDVLYKIANLGFKIAVVGVSECVDHPNIKSFGKVDPFAARKIIMKAKYGLNFTPDIFPLNVQDSTKVIEYCGLGLGVITNDYFWVRDFLRKRGGRFLFLDDIRSYEDVTEFDFENPDVSGLDWHSISHKLFDELCGYFDFPC